MITAAKMTTATKAAPTTEETPTAAATTTAAETATTATMATAVTTATAATTATTSDTPAATVTTTAAATPVAAAATMTATATAAAASGDHDIYYGYVCEPDHQQHSVDIFRCTKAGRRPQPPHHNNNRPPASPFGAAQTLAGSRGAKALTSQFGTAVENSEDKASKCIPFHDKAQQEQVSSGPPPHGKMDC